MSDLRSRVGRRVAELRRKRGWTQQVLADLAKWTSGHYVARIEGGKENLSLDTIEKLAAIFDADPSAFFEEPSEVGPRRRGRPKSSS